MSAFESLRVALRALQLHPLRSTLTLLGVVIGVAALVAMVAIGGGASARVAEQIRTLGTNLLLVQPGSAIEGAARLRAGTRRSLSEDDAAALAAEVRGVLVAAPTVSGGAQLV